MQSSLVSILIKFKGKQNHFPESPGTAVCASRHALARRRNTSAKFSRQLAFQPSHASGGHISSMLCHNPKNTSARSLPSASRHGCDSRSRRLSPPQGPLPDLVHILAPCARCPHTALQDSPLVPSRLLREVGTGLTGVSSDLTWLLTAAELTQPWLMGSVSASLHIEGRGMAEARGGPRDHCPHAWLIHDGVARKQGRGVDRARPSRRLGWDGGGVHGGPLPVAA